MLSIIVPTFNEEKAIEKTLLGLRRLTSTPYELIVSDSGSSDATLEIAKKHADKVVAYNDLPKNAARGRNLGAEHAQGELLVFVDADITVDDINTFFPKAIQIFRDTPDLVAIGVKIQTHKEVETWGDKISHKIINFMCITTNNFFHAAAISGEFQMMRKAAFEKVGGYNNALNITEDNDLYQRLRKIGKIRTIAALRVLHGSRRAHARGWGKLWWELSINWVSLTFFGRLWHREWPHVR